MLKVGDKIRRKRKWAEQVGEAEGIIVAVFPVANSKYDILFVHCPNSPSVTEKSLNWIRKRHNEGYNISPAFAGERITHSGRRYLKECWERVDFTDFTPGGFALFDSLKSDEDPEVKRQLAFFSQDLKKNEHGPSGLLFP